MAIKKTALLLDQELVHQVKELLGTTTTTETIAEAMREVIRVPGPGPPLRAAAPTGAELE